MKLLVINYMSLPIPPVKGGAVEYLVNSFLLDNEEKHYHDVVAYSIYDEAAQKEAKKYKHTKFKFIKIESIVDKLDRAFRHLVNKYTSLSVGNTYISKVIRQEKDLNQYDTIIIENAPDFCLRIPKSFKGRLILHLHNDFLNSNTKNSKKIFERCDEIYTISDSLGKCVQTIAQSDKVKTLYNGIHLNKFSFSENTRADMRKKYKISDDNFVFMYSGRIVPDKGVYELVKAFNELPGDKIKLILVGGTGYSKNDESAYRKKIKEIKDDRIICTGFIPYDEMSAVYTIADVGVIPSVFNDPFNLTTIEFCANCIPIVISDRGAMKELVNNRCALIAKCDESFVDNIHKALEIMYSKRDEIKEMGKEAQKVSAKFSIENYCEKFNFFLNGGNDSI